MILLLLLLVAQCSCLTSLLKQHQTLHKDELQIRIFGQSIILSVDLFNRTFVASLSPYHEIFHKQFSVVGMDSGQSWRVDYDINDHFEGVIDNEPASLVRIHLHEGVITGTIILEGETIFIEPSWRHVKEPHDYHMIAYKMSDLIFNFGSKEQPGHFCGHNHTSKGAPTAESPFDYDFKILHQNVRNNTSSRFKRAKTKEDTCGIILVADYQFYSEVCQKSETITTSFLITLFDRVNRIFKKTYFASTEDPDYMGYGMNVKKVLIHTTPDPSSDHYNYVKDWDVSELLDTFGSSAGADKWSAYCLAHLFTNIDFGNGVLGLAYVASPISNKVGGICSRAFRGGRGKMRMLNIGLTTSVNYGRTLLTSELEIVTAHEIGHNWGSSHDPDNSKECAPYNNFYIMYPSAVDGTRSNNKDFSPCSRASIGSVLKYKSSCFEEASDNICGNSIVEDQEECDPGRVEEGKENPCCTADCKLRPTAQCSDSNALCCTDCQFASTNKTCYQGSDFDRSCNDVAYCTGVNAECGDPLKKSAGSPCYDEGTCSDSGVCLNFCEAKGLYLCAGEVACHWNCMDSMSGLCDKVFSAVANGKSCHDGTCVNGTCIEEAQDTQARIWTILSSLDSSTFVKWMGNNIVLVTVILSLVLWVPVCLLLRFLDDQHDEVDYVMETLRKKKELYKKETLKTQVSSVSANSFEMTHVFNLTGERF